MGPERNGQAKGKLPNFITDLIPSENDIIFNNEIFGIWMSMASLLVYTPIELY
jgi:hypothetical protein